MNSFLFFDNFSLPRELSGKLWNMWWVYISTFWHFSLEIEARLFFFLKPNIQPSSWEPQIACWLFQRANKPPRKVEKNTLLWLVPRSLLFSRNSGLVCDLQLPVSLQLCFPPPYATASHDLSSDWSWFKVTLLESSTWEQFQESTAGACGEFLPVGTQGSKFCAFWDLSKGRENSGCGNNASNSFFKGNIGTTL